MNAPISTELKKKTVWIAPDGYETEDEEEARRYVESTNRRTLVREYVSTLDFTNLSPRAQTAQVSMATERVMGFLEWALGEGRIKLS